MTPFNEGVFADGAAIPKEDLLTLRVFGRVLLAFGEDNGDSEMSILPSAATFLPKSYPLYSNRYDFKHLQREYAITLIFFGNDLRCTIATDEWKAEIWLNPPFAESRVATDIFGRMVREYYRATSFPLYDHVAEKLRDCRNGLTEADDIILAFWLMTYGLPSRHADRKCRFHGNQKTFERDMLVLKMDQQYADLCEKLMAQ